MNCAERLVALFGSQAEVARRFRVDRAVVNNWVKSGYVPARWAMEVEHVTDGQVSAVEILNEANARKPVRVKSRPDGENFHVVDDAFAQRHRRKPRRARQAFLTRGVHGVDAPLVDQHG